MNSRFALAVGTLSWMLTASLGAAPGPADLKAAPVPNRLGLTLHEYRFSWLVPSEAAWLNVPMVR